LGCNIPRGFLPCQEVDVAVICYLYLALRLPDVGCSSALYLPRCIWHPHETVLGVERCTAAGAKEQLKALG